MRLTVQEERWLCGLGRPPAVRDVWGHALWFESPSSHYLIGSSSPDGPRGTTDDLSINSPVVGGLHVASGVVGRAPVVIVQLVVMLGAAALVGCESSGGAPSLAVSDSAGVRVVEQGGVDGLPLVVVDPEPDLVVGWAAQDVPFQAIPDGGLLSDGSVVVFDEGATSLYFISPSGEEVEMTGGQGEGPGEFQSASSVAVLEGDTVVVYDPSLGRLSRFARDGRFLDSGTWRQEGMVFTEPAGATAAGELTWIPNSYALRRDQAGTVAVRGPLIRSGATGASPDTVAEVFLLSMTFEQGRPVRDPFMAFGHGSGFSGGFVWTYNALPEVRWYSEQGELEQVARWEATAAPVDDAIWAGHDSAYRARALSRTRRPTDEQLAQQLRSARDGAASTLPLFAFGFATDEGDVWLGEYRVMGGASDTYLVLTSDGVAASRVAFPRPIKILDIRGGRVLGVETNELDVQAIVVYSLDDVTPF